MNYYCFNFRENGLSEICDQLEEAKDARMEEEKKSELRRSLLEKIPECPVNIKLDFHTKSLNVLFLRFVLTNSRRIARSTAASLVITSVGPARPTSPSR